MPNKARKINTAIKAADSLSLGISVVVAILIGVAIGIGLQKLTGITALLFVGVFIGVAAAINNIYKAYKSQKASYDAIAKEREELARKTDYKC